jgi:hypothetical protein
MSIAYIQRATAFVASRVFPIIPVMKQSDQYFLYTKDWWFRTGALKRGPGTESAGGGFHIDHTNTFFCDVWSYHQDISDQIRANADQPIDLDRDATLYVTQNMLLRREIQFAQNYLNSGIWTGSTTGTDIDLSASGNIQWDLTGSDPMQDVDVQKQHIGSQTGYLPNTLVVSPDVHYVLRNNAAVMDRIKYTQRGVVTGDILASLFGVDNYLVAEAVVNTADEGATGAFQYLNKNVALLTYANPSPSILQPSGGYIFAWKGLYGAGNEGTRIKTFRMEHLESDRVEGDMAFSMYLTGADLGCFFYNVVTSADA